MGKNKHFFFLVLDLCPFGFSKQTITAESGPFCDLIFNRHWEEYWSNWNFKLKNLIWSYWTVSATDDPEMEW